MSRLGALRSPLLAASLLFFVARLALVLCAADRLSEPDAAEVKLMQLGDDWVRSGQAPSAERLLYLGRAGTNAPHGAWLLVSLLYALLVVPLGIEGSYLALKGVGLLFATVAFAAWTATARWLGGNRAAWGMGVLFLFLPPSFLGTSLVPWGSHPESMALLGLAALTLLSTDRGGRRALAGAGLLAGLAAGLNLLVAPCVALLLAGLVWDDWTRLDGRPRELLGRSVLLLACAAIPLGLCLAFSGSLGASVTETAGNSPLELLAPAGGDEPGLALASLGKLLPPRLWGPGPRGAADLLLLLVWAATAGWVLRPGALPRARQGRVLALCLGAPALHLAVLASYAPQRPDLPPRYLLPIVPMLLLAPALAIGASEGSARAQRLAKAAVLLLLLPGLSIHTELIRPARAPSFFDYQPARYVAAEIGHVDYQLAGPVGRFLDTRKEGDRLGFGFVTGVGTSDDGLGRAELELVPDPSEVLSRRATWIRSHPVSPQRRLLHENLGWALAVVAPDRRGLWLSLLSRIGDDRDDAARGLGMGLSSLGPEGCARLERSTGSDLAAMRAGARAMGGCE